MEIKKCKVGKNLYNAARLDFITRICLDGRGALSKTSIKYDGKTADDEFL